MFVLSDGRVFDAGPDRTTRILDPATWTWSTVGTSPIDGHSAVMYRPNKVMKSGTWADPDFNGATEFNAGPGTAVIDMSAPTPAWRSTAPMAHSRSYHNMTLLPDGTVLASGGMTTSDGTREEDAVLPAEIWNPDTETWTTVASLTNPRLYHSTALLLPDGRVLMAGGGALPGRATDQKNAEIYSPPYLFKGPRPTISSAPSAANYGASFDVTTPNAGQIAKVSLVRSPSVTHAFDQNQRFQFLNFTVGAGKVTVQAPAGCEPRSAGRLPALPRRHERRPVRWLLHPRCGHVSADRSVQPDGDWLAGAGGALVDGVGRQRRRGALQRPSRGDSGLHALGGEPDRAAHRHELR